MLIAKTWLWMQIWLMIKVHTNILTRFIHCIDACSLQPNLKCTQFGKYKKEYEDKIAIAEVK